LSKKTFPKGTALRFHFHRFMARVHGELICLSGEKNPLHSAKGFAAERVLLSSMSSTADIGDAMILANLLRAPLDLGDPGTHLHASG
jgi:cell division protein ZapE